MWASLAFAVLLLNASLTFENVWPTPAIIWRGGLSIELAACMLGLSFATRRFGPPSRRAIRAVAAIWVPLVLARYASVTAPAIYGRDINLYWDVRHLSGVAGLLAAAAPTWLILLTIAAFILIPLLLYWPLRWAYGRLAAGMTRDRERRLLQRVAVAMALVFVAQRFAGEALPLGLAPAPVTQTYARQLTLLAKEVTGTGRSEIGASPPLTSDLSRLAPADVLLVFVESYGAASYDRPEFSRGLAQTRERFEQDVHATGREVVSAFVESPTFGGSSWLAHISLLTGLEVRDEDTNSVLMTQQRRTLLSTFERHGYRTVAVMPGLQSSWPEGVFYGFDTVYGGEQLRYRGPDFGWWSIPDQFTIAQIDAVELRPGPRPPVLVFFPTISTHTPFSPIAPYQPDWARILTPEPYETADVDRAWNETPDWMDLGPSYVRAVAYDLDSLGGYLRLRKDRDLVMILIGDHQPPAVVSGEGAPWDVPVHIITTRHDIVEQLVHDGFRRGLTPQRPHIGKMHTLTPLLLDAFGTPSE